MSKQVLLKDLPLRPFHVGVAFSGTGGQFSDGFVLGIIGIAVSMAAGPLHLNALWIGLLGAASLAGLFFGSMLAGPIADRRLQGRYAGCAVYQGAGPPHSDDGVG